MESLRNRRALRALVLASFSMALGGAMSPVRAANILYFNAASGNWGTATNWGPINAVPVAGDQVYLSTDNYFGAPTNVAVTVNAPASATYVDLCQGISGPVGTASLTLASTASFSVTSVRTGGSLIFTPGSMLTGHNLTLNGGTASGNGGTGGLGGFLNLNDVIVAGGSTFHIYANDHVNNLGASGPGSRLTLHGDPAAPTVYPYDYTRFNAYANLSAGGVIALDMANLYLGGLDISGAGSGFDRSLNGGRISINGALTLSNSASFELGANEFYVAAGFHDCTLSSGATLIKSSNYDEAGSRMLSLSGASVLDLRAGIFETTDASITGASDVKLNGGILRIRGALTVNNATISRPAAGAGLDFQGVITTPSMAVINGGTVTLLNGDTYQNNTNFGIAGTGSKLTNHGTFANTLGFLAIGDSGELDLRAGILRTNLLLMNGTAPGVISRNGGLLWVKSATVDVGATMTTVAGDTIPTGGTFNLQGGGRWVNSSTSGDISLINMSGSSLLDLRAGTLFTDELKVANSTIGFNGGNLVVKQLKIGVGTNVQRTTGSFTARELILDPGANFTLESSDNFTSLGSKLVVTNNAQLTIGSLVTHQFESATVSNGGVIHLNNNYVNALDIYVGDTSPGTLDRGGPWGAVFFRGLHVLAGSQVDVTNVDSIMGNGDLEVFGGSVLNFNSDSGFMIPGVFNNVRIDASNLNLNPGGDLYTKNLSVGHFSHPSNLNRNGGRLNIQNSITVAGGSTLNLLSTDNITAPLDFVLVKEASTLGLSSRPIDTKALTISGGSNINRTASPLTLRNELIVTDASTFSVAPTDTLNAGLTVQVLLNSTLNVNNSPASALGPVTVSSSTLNLTGGALHAASAEFASGTLSRLDGSTLDVDGILSGSGSSVVDFLPGDVTGSLTLTGNALGRLTQGPGDVAGLTIESDLSLTSPASLSLIFDSNDETTLDWALRWTNPIVGDRVAAINSLIGSGSITVTGHAYDVFSQDGFTYVAAIPSPVPEPGALALLAIPAVSLLKRRRR